MRVCAVRECTRRHKAKGLCRKHYERQRRGVLVPTPRRYDATTMGEMDRRIVEAGTYQPKRLLTPKQLLDRAWRRT